MSVSKCSGRIKPKSVDIGKIMALKNAGWSIGKIAEEMGMKPQAVSNAIYRYRKNCGGVV